MNGSSGYDGVFLWCRVCNRCYLRGEFCLVGSQWSDEEIENFRRWKVDGEVLETMRKSTRKCPYGGCGGCDGIDWERVRAVHPEYPVIPVKCKRYLLF